VSVRPCLDAAETQVLAHGLALVYSAEVTAPVARRANFAYSGDSESRGLLRLPFRSWKDKTTVGRYPGASRAGPSILRPCPGRAGGLLPVLVPEGWMRGCFRWSW
jgi:hypothetical protein